MIISWGDYSFDSASITPRITRRAVIGPRGYRTGVVTTWDLTGELRADDVSALATKIAAFEAAFSINGLDLTISLDGTTVYAFRSSDTVGGINVVSLSYPNGEGAEFSTFRTVAVTLEGTTDNPEQNLVAFFETLTFSGTGGPRYVYLPTLNGPPVKQIVQQQTVQTITQSGSATGHSSYPTTPAPLFPAAERQEQRRITTRAPREVRGKYVDWSVDWQYTFEFATPQAVRAPNLTTEA